MFLDEYQIIEFFGPLSSDLSIIARHTESSALHVLHILAGGDAETNQRLIETASRLSGDAGRYYIGTLTHRKVPVMVTHPLPGGATAREWLQPYLPEIPYPKVPQMPALVEQKPAPKPEQNEPKPQENPKPDTGEFTQFLRESGAEPPPRKPPAPEPVSAHPPQDCKSGDATEILSAPEPEFPARPASQERGSFTEFMRSASSPDSPSSHRVDSAEKPIPAPPNKDPGGFTQMMEASRYQSSYRSSPSARSPEEDLALLNSSQPPVTEATKVFTAPPAREAWSQRGATAQPAGPGEYTLAVEARPPAPAAAPAAAGDSQSNPARAIARPSLLFVSIILALLVAAAIFAIIIARQAS